MNDSLAKVAKASRIIFPILALAMIAVGAFRYFAEQNYAALGEDGILALFFIAAGYVVTPIVNALDKMQPEVDEEGKPIEHDQGL